MKEPGMVELLKSQHPLGMEMLYEYAGAQIYGILEKISTDEKAAEKLMVQTFINAWRKAPSLPRDHPNLLAWILELAVETIEHQLKSGHLNKDQIKALPELSKDMAANGYKSSIWARLEESSKNDLYDEAVQNNIPENKLQYAVLAIRTRLKINEAISRK